jgi:broad specificity phosphatase PhoE
MARLAAETGMARDRSRTPNASAGLPQATAGACARRRSTGERRAALPGVEQRAADDPRPPAGSARPATVTMPAMGTLYLVRHGQASFGAADYDQLSALGTRQCHELGVWFRDRGVRFEAVLRGTQRRHAQSLAALAAGHGEVPEALEWPGLNEFDSAAVIGAIHPLPLAAADDRELQRAYFRQLRAGLAGWMAGQTAPVGMGSYADWAAGVAAALEHVRTRHRGNVLLVSSGGPIATAVAQVLGTPAEAAIELNMGIRNSALTEFSYTPERHILVSYNHLPHLDAPERRDWVTRI